MAVTAEEVSLPAQNPAESESEDDDVSALLPKHTKVAVIGNNRTKQSLVGKRGIVKKAVGLGGWHLLVSTTTGCISANGRSQMQLQKFILCARIFLSFGSEGGVEPALREVPRSKHPLFFPQRVARLWVPSRCRGLDTQVLETGEEVRLQRNALAVLEAPTGQESVRPRRHFSTGPDGPGWAVLNPRDITGREHGRFLF
jgi:hypothetical protein